MGSRDDDRKPYPSVGDGKENQGVHVCRRCQWPFPNAHPSQKKRAAHKKQCGSIEGYPVVDSDGEVSFVMYHGNPEVEEELGGKGKCNSKSSTGSREFKGLVKFDGEDEIEDPGNSGSPEAYLSEGLEMEGEFRGKGTCLENSGESKESEDLGKSNIEDEIKNLSKPGATDAYLSERIEVEEELIGNGICLNNASGSEEIKVLGKLDDDDKIVNPSNSGPPEAYLSEIIEMEEELGGEDSSSKSKVVNGLGKSEIEGEIKNLTRAGILETYLSERIEVEEELCGNGICLNNASGSEELKDLGKSDGDDTIENPSNSGLPEAYLSEMIEMEEELGGKDTSLENSSGSTIIKGLGKSDIEGEIKYPTKAGVSETCLSERIKVDEELRGNGICLNNASVSEETKALVKSDGEDKVEEPSILGASDAYLSEKIDVGEELGGVSMCNLENSCKRKEISRPGKSDGEDEIKNSGNLGALEAHLLGKALKLTETLNANQEELLKDKSPVDQLRNHLQSKEIETADSSAEDEFMLKANLLMADNSSKEMILDDKEIVYNVITDTILDGSASKLHLAEEGQSESGQGLTAGQTGIADSAVASSIPITIKSTSDVTTVTREHATGNLLEMYVKVLQFHEVVDPVGSSASVDFGNKPGNHAEVPELTKTQMEIISAEQMVNVGILPPPLQQQENDISSEEIGHTMLHSSLVTDAPNKCEAGVPEVKANNIFKDLGSGGLTTCTVAMGIKALEDHETTSDDVVSSSIQLTEANNDLPHSARKEAPTQILNSKSAGVSALVNESKMEKVTDIGSSNVREDGFVDITSGYDQKVKEDSYKADNLQASQRLFGSNQLEDIEVKFFDAASDTGAHVNASVENGNLANAPSVTDINSRLPNDIKVTSEVREDTGDNELINEMEKNASTFLGSVSALKGNNLKNNSSEVNIKSIHEKSIEYAIDNNSTNSYSEVVVNNEKKEVGICAFKNLYVDLSSTHGNQDGLLCYSSLLHTNDGCLNSVGTQHSIHDSGTLGKSNGFPEKVASSIHCQPSKDNAVTVEKEDGADSMIQTGSTESHCDSTCDETAPSTRESGQAPASNLEEITKTEQYNSANDQDSKSSCRSVGSQGRKRKEEIVPRAVDWNFVKHEIYVERVKSRAPLKKLLMEDDESKQGTQKATVDYASSPSVQPYSMQDGIRERKLNGSMNEEASSQSAINFMMQKEWNSPARLPVRKNTKRKMKEKQQWSPFMCC